MTDPAKPELVGFGVANYRSFDEEGFVIDDIRKINVFIGKNNSGKSNILRAIRLLKRVKLPKMHQGEKSGYQEGLGLKPEIDSHHPTGTPPSVTLCVPFERMLHREQRATPYRDRLPDTLSIRWNTATGQVERCPTFAQIEDRILVALAEHVTSTKYLHRPNRDRVLNELQQALLHPVVLSTRALERLICVENFREIRTVSDAESEDERFNGYNVIARLREMQHPKIGHEHERTVFDRIERFVRDLLAEPNLSMEVPTLEDAIYVSMHGKRLPLGSYGTGLHQLVILCAALAMHDDYVVCIEEPEIHIHPELQRKFLRFIAGGTSNRYFITTHSNVFLDFVPDVAIYHVMHDGMKSTVTRVEATSRARDVLADLGYKASDLLQANCVIWVEGPSDRVYLNKWLSLVAPDLVEGIHYAITFYGGKVLAHFAAVDDPADDLVEVLRINQHAIFMMDRDNVAPSGKLNATKERIQKEIGQQHCWVTQGREIENYLRPELLKQYLSDKCDPSVSITFNGESRIEEAITTATDDVDGPKFDYANAKVAYARAFCERMNEADLDVLDLRDRLVQLVKLIRQWNHMSTDGTAALEAAEITDE